MSDTCEVCEARDTLPGRVPCRPCVWFLQHRLSLSSNLEIGEVRWEVGGTFLILATTIVMASTATGVSQAAAVTASHNHLNNHCELT